MKSHTIKLDIESRQIADDLGEIIENSEFFTLVPPEQDLRPDLLICELGEDHKAELKNIQSYMEQSDRTEVFLVSRRSDPEILIQVLQTGVKEFFPVPIKKQMVEEALDRFKTRQEKKEQLESKKQGKIISVVGSKGGVGTTTIAVNQAVSIAKNQKIPSVALLDMNIVFGEVPVFLDMAPKYHWGDITKNIQRLDVVFLSNILSKHETGVHVLPSPRYLGDHPSPTPPIMEALLALMKKQYDFIIIDLGQTMNDTALKIIQMSYLTQIVAIQSLPCMSNTNRLIKSFLGFGYTRIESIHVVLNRFFNKSTVSLDTVREGIGREPAWIIPNDYSTTMSAINSGKPLYMVSPRSKIVKSFDEYTGQFIGKEKKKKKGWLF